MSQWNKERDIDGSSYRIDNVCVRGKYGGCDSLKVVSYQNIGKKRSYIGFLVISLINVCTV